MSKCVIKCKTTLITDRDNFEDQCERWFNELNMIFQRIFRKILEQFSKKDQI